MPNYGFLCWLSGFSFSGAPSLKLFEPPLALWRRGLRFMRILGFILNPKRAGGGKVEIRRPKMILGCAESCFSGSVFRRQPGNRQAVFAKQHSEHL